MRQPPRAVDLELELVQLTPPGSVRGLNLVVADIAAARQQLLGRGVDVGEVTDAGGGVLCAGLHDPDGNTLVLQQMPLAHRRRLLRRAPHRAAAPGPS